MNWVRTRSQGSCFEKPEVFHYLYVADKQKKRKRKTRQDGQREPEKERFLLCRRCDHKITRPDYRISVQGSVDHTFLNPSGQVFHLNCFKRADGSIVTGDASAEWTWFKGFKWQVALCGQCLTHLGWFYRSDEESSFFGLILDALV